MDGEPSEATEPPEQSHHQVAFLRFLHLGNIILNQIVFSLANIWVPALTLWFINRATWIRKSLSLLTQLCSGNWAMIVPGIRGMLWINYTSALDDTVDETRSWGEGWGKRHSKQLEKLLRGRAISAAARVAVERWQGHRVGWGCCTDLLTSRLESISHYKKII